MNQLVESKPTLRLHPARAHTAPGTPAAPVSRLGAWLRQRWQKLWMDDLTAYLSQAESAIDLEYRIRNWNEHERRCGRLPLL